MTARLEQLVETEVAEQMQGHHEPLYQTLATQSRCYGPSCMGCHRIRFEIGKLHRKHWEDSNHASLDYS